VLTEEAYERLKTIGEFTDLGSGFKIAMRDLEIRGAGNLLGADQSGQIAAVGFDLYCQMVTEAVAELQGEKVPEPADVAIELPVDANLPRDYVERDDVRMEAYRRLAAVTGHSDVDDIRAEWEDRYGPLPAAAEALIAAARLRAEAVRLGIRTLTVQAQGARVRGLELRESQKVRLARLAPGSRVGADEVFVALKVRPADAAMHLVELLRSLAPPESVAPIASPAS
jgi:transcription-repair coupling factor (superfamily II helicase)